MIESSCSVVVIPRGGKAVRRAWTRGSRTPQPRWGGSSATDPAKTVATRSLGDRNEAHL